MKVALVKESNGMWKPAYEQDHNDLKKFPVNKVIEVEIKDAERSVDMHRCCMAFIKHIYDNQDIIRESFNKFRQILLLNIGYTDIKWRKVEKGKYEEIETAKSMSFANMSQKEFGKLFTDIKKFAYDYFQLSFDVWYKNEWVDENACQIETCHQPATDLHEIVPGSFRRKYCIEKGWQVRLCRTHHKWAHGIMEKHEEKLSTDQYEAFKTFCKILKIDPLETWKEIHTVREDTGEEVF